jgi:hypothetical protein
MFFHMRGDYVDTVFRDVFYKDTVRFVTRDALGFQVNLYPLRTPFFHGDIVNILFKDSNIRNKKWETAADYGRESGSDKSYCYGFLPFF